MYNIETKTFSTRSQMYRVVSFVLIQKYAKNFKDILPRLAESLNTFLGIYFNISLRNINESSKLLLHEISSKEKVHSNEHQKYSKNVNNTFNKFTHF